MITTIPKEITFDLPEGVYSANLVHIKPRMKQTGKGPQEWVRLLFQVNIPAMSHLTCMAGRNFTLDLRQGSDLRNFLESWLGRKWFLERSGRKIDLECLCGMPCEVTLTHFQGKNYESPCVVVAQIAAVGSKALQQITIGKD